MLEGGAMILLIIARWLDDLVREARVAVRDALDALREIQWQWEALLAQLRADLESMGGDVA